MLPQAFIMLHLTLVFIVPCWQSIWSLKIIKTHGFYFGSATFWNDMYNEVSIDLEVILFSSGVPFTSFDLAVHSSYIIKMGDAKSKGRTNFLYH